MKCLLNWQVGWRRFKAMVCPFFQEEDEFDEEPAEEKLC